MDSNMTDDMQALRRLLPDDTVVTPDALAVALGWLLARLRQEADNHTPGIYRVWARASDIATLYGISRAQAHAWLRVLRARGAVRMQRPLSGAGGKGDTYYRLADIEAAYRYSGNTGQD